MINKKANFIKETKKMIQEISNEIMSGFKDIALIIFNDKKNNS